MCHDASIICSIDNNKRAFIRQDHDEGSIEQDMCLYNIM